MTQLTEEILNRIKKDHWYIFNELQRKDALLLAQEMEKESYGLKTTNPSLYHDWINYVAQLRWVAFPLMQKNEDMANLVQNYFLEGLANDDLDLIKTVTQRGEFLFGIGSREFLAQILSALRANSQEIGREPIMIKGETALLRPAIKNWLVDYLRAVPEKNPSEMDETNYLFKNPNTKKLDDADKKTLGKVLEFYDTFKYIVDQLAMAEMQKMVPAPPVKTQQQNKPVMQPRYQPPQPAAPITPKPMHAPRPVQNASQNPYLEPISDTNETQIKGKVYTENTNKNILYSKPDSQLPIANYQPLPQQSQSAPAQQLNHSSPQSLNHSSDDFDHLRQAPPQFDPFARQQQPPQAPQPRAIQYETPPQPQRPMTPRPIQPPQPSSQQEHANAIKNYYDQLARQVPPAPSSAGQSAKIPAQPQQQTPPFYKERPREIYKTSAEQIHPRPLTPSRSNGGQASPPLPPEGRPAAGWQEEEEMPAAQPQPRPMPDSIRQYPKPANAGTHPGTLERNNYLEPIEENDLPRKPSSQRPPDDRIMGNIVDLKNLDH
jgi:DNA-binding transcriptional regulator of glucitol operon